MKKIKDISVVLIFQIINLLLSLFLTPFFLSNFSKEEYGLMILLSQIINFIGFLDLGIASFIIQKISSKGFRLSSTNNSNRLVSTSISILSFICLLLLPFIFLISFYIGEIFKFPFPIPTFTKILVFFALFTSFASLITKPFNSLLYSEEKFFSLNLLGNSSIIIYNILTYIFIKYGFELNSFLYALIIGNIANLLLTFFLFSRKKSDLLYSPTLPKKKELYYLINGGFYLFLNGIAAQIIYNGDRIIVAKFVSIATLTIFTINIRTIEIIQMFVMRISDTFIPKIIKIASENLDKAMIYYVSFTKISVIGVIFLQINFLLFNTSFIKLWVGEEFLLNDKSVIPLYLIVFFLHIVFRIPSLFLYAIGKNKQYSFVSLIEAVINLSLSIILAHYFEIKGIVIATIIALFLTSIPSNLYFLNKYFEARISYYKSISPLIVPLLLLSPALIAAYLLNERVMKLITNWYLFFTFVVLFNLIFLPLIVLINYRKMSLFFSDLKFLNSSAYK